MNILLIFPGFILAFIIVLYYKRKMENMYAKIDAAYNNKNRVHFMWQEIRMMNYFFIWVNHLEALIYFIHIKMGVL